MSNNFDLSALALASVCPGNEILYDDVGMPSVMVKIPKLTYAQLGMGESTAVHPAFIINGTEVDALWISKYQNIVHNGRAYSLPGQNPKASLNFDTARGYCEAKGEGWHLMTAIEWGLIKQWCENNGFTPKGNNNYGKHSSEASYKAIPMTWGSDGKINHVATGTGPLTWSHDGSLSGIFDLCGNVWEWTGGIRTVYGELQILANNNAADGDHSQLAAGTEWKAISAEDGSLITPDGSGTTDGSVKMDFVSSKLTYCATITAQSDTSRGCQFGNIACASDIGDNAKLALQALGFLPYATSSIHASNYCYFNNGAAERAFYSGGYWSSSGYGLASFSGNGTRSYTNTGIGFRAAFAELPSD